MTEPGLRERKKAKTRAAIQRHALRLFHEQGYEATTVSQITEAAEISDATFFRYFPSKEAVVLWDGFDPVIYQAFAAQSPELGIIPAFRAALRESFAGMTSAESHEVRQRITLIMSTPTLRAQLINQLFQPLDELAGIVAARSGLPSGSAAARATAGAIIGVGLAALLSPAPRSDLVLALDEGLAALESGLLR